MAAQRVRLGAEDGPPVTPGTAAGAVEQLYYTSCERGLSGFSGFQFNAVSPGVTAEAMHTVESLAGYDPPRTLAESETSEQLARCPVTLCFSPAPPGPGSAQGTTLVNVRYVGRDSARRFGNYFAHALHSPSAKDFAAACGGRLAIELWGSPVWTATVSARPELPPLGGDRGPVPAGPLDARAVGEFLAGRRHADQLEQLLAAAFQALAGGPSVVLVDRSTERIAHWFAAVSFLLPPALARQLSFSTYMLRPTRGRHHLIGSVPEARPEIGPDDEDAFLLFDFAAGRFPEAVPVHHVVRLLTRIGVGSVRSVWSWAAEYTDGTERHPGDWHPPVAAAAAAGGVRLARPDVAAVLDWLPGAAHLGATRAVVARDLWRARLASGLTQLDALARAARDGGDRALHRELEGALLETRLRAYVRGAPTALAPEPVTGPAELTLKAVELWERLVGEADTARERARLLLWAVDAEVLPSAALRARVCRGLAGELLRAATGRAPDPALRADVKRLVSVSAEFRAALLGRLDELLDGRAGQHDLFAQFPAELLTFADLEGRPPLQEHHLLASAERDPASSAQALLRILAVRGQDFPDGALLRAVWRGVPWTHREAVRLALALPPGSPEGRGGDEGLAEWFDRVVHREVTDEAGLETLLDLCELLDAPERRVWLSPDTAATVRRTLDLDGQLKAASDAARLAAEFAGDPLPAPVRALRRLRLAGALLAAPAEPGVVPGMLRDLTFDTADRYLRELQKGTVRACERRHTVSDRLLGHVGGLALARRGRLGLPESHRTLVNHIVFVAANEWRAEDTERLAALVRPHDAAVADAAAELARERRAATAKGWRRLTDLGRFGRSGRDPEGRA
ncbi:GTPase-associated protein 1-related protein [Streptomyces sp. NPDC006458]|uniref:GTPase-associated protein 1-related protein n=1 Tax=Streptomyces sp. NPDC006458 TaxID=3154302 RepID=UPI0033A46362